MSPTPGRSKPITRRTVLSLRDAMPADDRAVASAEIARRANVLLQSANVIALYAPKGSEVDTAAMDLYARAAGKRVVYPRVVDEERRLAFHAVRPEDLVAARFGLREPRADAPAVEISAIDAFVVPGLAFDRAGGRIGWGRGHYDATLAAAAQGAQRVGLSFECQLIDSVPNDPHDAVLSVIVTELATYRTAA